MYLFQTAVEKFGRRIFVFFFGLKTVSIKSWDCLGWSFHCCDSLPSPIVMTLVIGFSFSYLFLFFRFGWPLINASPVPCLYLEKHPEPASDQQEENWYLNKHPPAILTRWGRLSRHLPVLTSPTRGMLSACPAFPFIPLFRAVYQALLLLLINHEALNLFPCRTTTEFGFHIPSLENQKNIVNIWIYWCKREHAYFWELKSYLEL